MLILRRLVNEQILFVDHFCITILDMTNKHVRVEVKQLTTASDPCSVICAVHVEQSMSLNGEIIITILAISRRRAKLGIAAPDHITVLRGELQERFSPHTPAQEE